MKVLVVGNGGREHAIAWKLAQSTRVERVFATRPNAGMASFTEGVDIGVDDVPALVEFAARAAIDLTVVGPELPLTLGLVDAMQARGLRAFGPSAAAAELEGSKAFAKEIMVESGVPTARYGTFSEMQEALAWVQDFDRGVVVKADGLAAGKGVILCETVEEAEAALREMLESRRFGDAGGQVVVEELLYGEEASFIAVCDGSNVVPLASSQDHKRIGEGDTGPNTGGMGAYSPAPVVTAAMSEQVMREVMEPVVSTMARRGTPFVGFLYAGLMFTSEGPRVLEFNVRLGDPETQPLMMRMESDLAELLGAALDGRLAETTLRWFPGAALGVVLASEGYPGSGRRGDVIEGLEAAAGVDGVRVFHAGTARRDGEVVTAGGRVLCVTARGEDVRAAAAQAYEAVEMIRWSGCQWRPDIGWRALSR